MGSGTGTGKGKATDTQAPRVNPKLKRKKWRCVNCRKVRKYPTRECVRLEDCGCRQGHWLPLFVADEPVHSLVCFDCYNNAEYGFDDQKEAEMVREQRMIHEASQKLRQKVYNWSMAWHGKFFKGASSDEAVISREFDTSNSDSEEEDAKGATGPSKRPGPTYGASSAGPARIDVSQYYQQYAYDEAATFSPEAEALNPDQPQATGTAASAGTDPRSNPPSSGSKKSSGSNSKGSDKSRGSGNHKHGKDKRKKNSGSK